MIRAGQRAHARAALPLLAVIAALLACSSARTTPTSLATAAAAEPRIDALVTDWFARLADGASDRRAALKRTLDLSFELSRRGQTTQDVSKVDAWLDELRSPHPRVEFTVEALRVTVSEDEAALYEARFAVARRAHDARGALHLARKEYRWLVRLLPDSPPVIARIEESPTLSFPGTGPRIVCN